MCLLSHHRAGGWRSRSDTPLPAAAHGAGRPKHTASAGAAPAPLPLPALRLPPQQGTCSEPSSVLTCGVQDLGGWGGDAWGRTVLGCQRRKPCAPLSWSPHSMGTSGFRLPEVSAPDFAAESSACDGETVPKTYRVLLTNPILLQSPSPPRSEHSCPVGPLRPDPPLPPL